MPHIWLITGCSSGFGAALARSLLSRGQSVVATARDPVTLEPLRKIGAACLQLDVTASQEVLDTKAQQALAFYGRIDVLVNNAGYAQLGSVEETR